MTNNEIEDKLNEIIARVVALCEKIDALLGE